jgi:hypothetical protein
MRKSRKYGCKWKIIAEALASNKFHWTLRAFANPQHSRHNHEPNTTPSAHPIHRKLTNPVKIVIESTNQRVGIKARDIKGIVQQQFPELAYIARDIYNARAIVTRDKLGVTAPAWTLLLVT